MYTKKWIFIFCNHTNWIFWNKSYFYKLVCMLVKIQISLHIFTVWLVFTVYSIRYAVYLTDQAAEMRRLIRVFIERICYFAEINVICFFSICQKLWNSFSIVYCIFYDKTCFPVRSIINRYLLKAEGHYYYTLNCWGTKKNKEIFFLIFFVKWNLTFHANSTPLRLFAWHVISYFMGKIRKSYLFVVC